VIVFGGGLCRCAVPSRGRAPCRGEPAWTVASRACIFSESLEPVDSFGAVRRRRIFQDLSSSVSVCNGGEIASFFDSNAERRGRVCGCARSSPIGMWSV